MYYSNSTDFQQGPCPWFVQGLFNLMDRIDPVSHCDEIGACGELWFEPTQSVPELNELPKKAKNGICSTCQLMIQQVKDTLDDPETVDDVRKKLDSLCDFLRIVNQDRQCRQQVDNYLDQVIDFIKSVDPKAYCASIHLCDGKARVRVDSKHDYPQLADFNNFGIETSVVVGDAKVKDINTVARPMLGPNCALCKTIVKELFHFLKENKTESNIQAALERVCDIIHHHHPEKVGECREMVKAYARELIQLLVDETNPDLICTLIEQCTYQEKEKAVTLGEFITKLSPAIDRGSVESCLECKMFIQFLRNKIDKPQSEEKIKQFLLKQLCDTLDDQDLKTSCENLIHTYADVIFKAVIEELNPEKACVALDACTKRTNLPQDDMIFESQLQQETLQQVPTKCSTCMEVTDQIDQFMSTSPIHDLSTVIDNICPKVYNKQGCDDIMKNNGYTIVGDIIMLKDSLQICSELEYCAI